MTVPVNASPEREMNVSDMEADIRQSHTTPGQHMDALRKILPGPPTVVRAFPMSEVLGLAVQIYDRESAVHHVEMRTTVTGTDGREVFRHDEQQSSTQRAATGGASPYTTTLALQSLSPGRYTLTIEARSSLAPALSARRDVPFEILP